MGRPGSEPFLVDQYHLDHQIVIDKLMQQSELHSGGIDRLLSIHHRTVPEFVELVRVHLSTDSAEARLLRRMARSE
jgi:hypothetical protein